MNRNNLCAHVIRDSAFGDKSFKEYCPALAVAGSEYCAVHSKPQHSEKLRRTVKAQRVAETLRKQGTLFEALEA